MATGLLVLCLGPSTRLVEYMAGHTKRYEGTISLGTTTDTDDADGQPLAERPVPPMTPADLPALERSFSGAIHQVPPAYSAVKVAGQRAYAAARSGQPLALAARPVTVFELRLDLLDATTLGIAVACSAGTYVRSLARDIGALLGCGAHLASLRRTRVGPLRVEDAWTLVEIAEAAATCKLAHRLLPADEGLLDRPVAVVTDQHARAIAQGGAIAIDRGGSAPGVLRLYSVSGSFLGTGALEEGAIRPLKVVASGVS